MPLTPPEVVRVAPQEALAVHGVLTPDEIAGFFDTVFDEVASTAERAGLVLAGPPFGFYPEMPAERIVVEAGFPVSGPAATDGRVHRLVLPGGDVVVATHLGGYDTLAQSYEEPTRWMQEQQLQPGPRVWESYTSDPAAEPDPSRWRTVLHCPLAAPGEGGPTGECVQACPWDAPRPTVDGPGTGPVPRCRPGPGGPVNAELNARRTERESTRVLSAHARSWQLVSALRVDDFDVAHLGRADQVILDMEDAIDDSLKQKARDNVLAWFAGGGSAWVRINDVTTPFWSDDLLALADSPGVLGVMLAKTESAEQVTVTHHRLGGHVPVIPLVESALGIEEATSIARAPGAHRLAFGSGDYRKDTGTANEPVAMAYPRSRLVLASRIGGLTGPIDGPTVGTTHSLLREQSEDAVVLGMTGKLCLDHEQPAVINEEFSPSPADVSWAIDFLEKFEAGGRVIRDGSDKPRLARAEVITRRASYFHVDPR